MRSNHINDGPYRRLPLTSAIGFDISISPSAPTFAIGHGLIHKERTARPLARAYPELAFNRFMERVNAPARRRARQLNRDRPPNGALGCREDRIVEAEICRDQKIESILFRLEGDAPRETVSILPKEADLKWISAALWEEQSQQRS